MGITQEATKAYNRFSLKTAALKEPYADLAGDVIKGLSCATKTLPAKYFYDEHGSKLFDKICDTKEYYPTRVEIKHDNKIGWIVLDQIRTIDKQRIIKQLEGLSKPEIVDYSQ